MIKLQLVIFVSHILLSQSQSPECDVFKQSACSLKEENLVGYQSATSPTECQARCADKSECNFFTYFQEMQACYLQISCDSQSNCDGCVCGPTLPEYSSCTSESSTTTTTTTTSTTTPPTTTAAACGDIKINAQCDLDDLNILDTLHHLSVGECQDACVRNAECTWFTWYNDEGADDDQSLCMLLRHCDDMEPCPGCVSGPASGVDVDVCNGVVDTTITTTTTTTMGPSTTTSAGGSSTTNTMGSTTTTTSFDSTTTNTMGSTTTTSGGSTTTNTMGSTTTTTMGSTTTTSGGSTTTSSGGSTTTTADQCDVFSEAACDITEYNTVGVKHDLTVGSCQDMCSGNVDCHAFTWYPSIGNLGICFLLKECNDLEVCPYCVSGPGSGTDVDSCYDFTTTTATSTTTQTTTSGSGSTTTADECGVFTEATCDITDSNNLDLVHDVAVGTCQDMCAGNPTCNWFTWYSVYGVKGTCWFLDHCNSQEPCGECVSGPADGPDVDQCI